MKNKTQKGSGAKSLQGGHKNIIKKTKVIKNKIMKQQILQCDETEIMYYLNKSWDIIAQCPNPYPQPRMYFYIRRYLAELPTQEELEIIKKEATEFSRTQKFY